MVLPSTGSISAKQIRKEFGQHESTGKINLGSYRVSQAVSGMPADLTLDDGIPHEGAISFANFRGKRLNIVCTYSTDQNQPSNPKTKYNAATNSNPNGITIIGGFKKISERPQNGKGARIHINVNAIIGSSKTYQSNQVNARRTVALKTGTWDSTCKLRINIAEAKGLYGSGGDGGGGADDEGKNQGGSGGHGSSALGIQHAVEEITIAFDGRIAGGGGGGGGSGGAKGKVGSEKMRIGGAGGGGGAGLPAGAAGLKNSSRAGIEAASGSAGTRTDGGAGGYGGFQHDEEREAGVKSGGGGGGGSTIGINEVGAGGIRGSDRDDNDWQGSQDNKGDTAGQAGTNGIGGKGGDGGEGDAEGQEQREANGGAGGYNGYAIVVKYGVTSPAESIFYQGGIYNLGSAEGDVLGT